MVETKNVQISLKIHDIVTKICCNNDLLMPYIEVTNLHIRCHQYIVYTSLLILPNTLLWKKL